MMAVQHTKEYESHDATKPFLVKWFFISLVVTYFLMYLIQPLYILCIEAHVDRSVTSEILSFLATHWQPQRLISGYIKWMGTIRVSQPMAALFAIMPFIVGIVLFIRACYKAKHMLQKKSN